MAARGSPAGLCSAAEWAMLLHPTTSTAGERGRQTGDCGQLSSDGHLCVVQKSLCLGKAALSWGRRADLQSRSIPFCLFPL